MIKKPTIAQFYKLGFNIKRDQEGSYILVLGPQAGLVTILPPLYTYDDLLQAAQYFLERASEDNTEGWRKNWDPVLKKMGLTS
jgi:hypothetical protein